MISDTYKVKLIGISGPSSSGKTTISRLLRDILPFCSIIYLDDFYKKESDLPINPETGLEDWDCPESFDYDRLKSMLAEIKRTGEYPKDFKSVEETSKTDLSKVITEPEFMEARRRLSDASITQIEATRYIIVEGILLYHDPEAVLPLLDVALFITAPYEELKRRRESRKGYVTQDNGFWVDPPGYFDQMVWPAYVKTHRHLFENEDVSTMKLSDDAVNKLKIQMAPIEFISNTFKILDWAAEKALEKANSV